MILKLIFLLLLLASSLLLPATSSALSVVTAQNNTGKPVLEPGDKIDIWIYHSQEDDFSEVLFCNSYGTALYNGGWDEAPFDTRMDSYDGEKTTVWIEFTIPADFSAYDSVFHFSGKFYGFGGGGFTVVGGDEFIVRGLPKKSSPGQDADVFDLVSFDWGRVAGAEQFNLRVEQVIDRIDPKHGHTSANELVLDTTVTETHLQYQLPGAGNYAWTIRAMAGGEWKPWTQATAFESLGTADVIDLRSPTIIKLFPQPAKDVVMIKCEDGIVRSAEIYDVNGRLVSTQGLTGVISRLNVQELPSGTYSVVLQLDGRQLQTLPLIKQ